MARERESECVSVCEECKSEKGRERERAGDNSSDDCELECALPI